MRKQDEDHMFTDGVRLAVFPESKADSEPPLMPTQLRILEKVLA